MEYINELIQKLNECMQTIRDISFEIVDINAEDTARQCVRDADKYIGDAILDLDTVIDNLIEITHKCPACGYYLTDDDYTYCLDCRSSNQDIYGYHEYTVTNDTNSKYTFGVELETSEAEGAVPMPYGWVCAEDSSITGLEYVSKVYSFNELRTNFKDDIGELCNELDYVCADTHKDIDTGLHIHIAESAFNCSRRALWEFILRYKYEFMAIGGRMPTRESFHYCEPKLNINRDGEVFDRYGLLNYNYKYNTVEFRFFNATLNATTIYMRVRLLIFLTHFSGSINDDTTFDDFMVFLSDTDDDLYNFASYWINKRIGDIKGLFK